MSESNDAFETIFKQQFELIHSKLDRLDEAIRGNGAPGINVRLDRLEQDAKRQGKLIWMIVGAGLTGVTTIMVAWLTG